MGFHTSGVLFKNSFGTAEMRGIFSEESFIENFLAVEAALARAEAKAGVIPENAAREITDKASIDYIALEDIEANLADTGLFTVSIIDAWRDHFGESGEYIHWGATSQDISDTAFMLQLRDGYELVQRDLDKIHSIMHDLAKEHRDTTMIGRTHHVQAIPITFGLKVATWLDEISRHIERLDQLRERLFVIQFFGATGTLASLGDVGIEVQRNLANDLELDVPDVAWFVSRDRFSELLSVFAMIAGTASKIANQILMLNRPEIDEVSEPPEGMVGSSTMPHKQNPVRSQVIVSLARLVRSHADTMMEVMDGHDERDFSTWLPEFAVISEAYLYLSRILKNIIEVLDGLIVNTEKMEANLRIFGGLIASERVMMALAQHIGRQRAHEIVHDNAIEAIERDTSFIDALEEDRRVTAHLSKQEIVRLTSPGEYTGIAARLVDRVLIDDAK